MQILKALRSVFPVVVVAFLGAAGVGAAPPASVATIPESRLEGFDGYPEAVKALVRDALELTRRGLAYAFGSNDPGKGGMDCSGTMNRLLLGMGLTGVPRQSSAFYEWVWKESVFTAVTSGEDGTIEMERLKPGDLLFWSGTYKVDHDPPITHVMVFLGVLKGDGRRVMMGASSGRRFEGIARHGVSVFDFQFPVKGNVTPSGTSARFIGYGSIPGLAEAYAKRPLAVKP